MDNQMCSLCPRQCRVDRSKSLGFCHVPSTIYAAKAMIHVGEEPCLIGRKEYEDRSQWQSGDRKARFGVGAIFFSGCNLRCVFCQNAVISRDAFGKEITKDRLGEILLELQDQGANCIDLVTPTPYSDQIAEVLSLLKPQLEIPIVYNCGGYESVGALQKLEGLVDIYLPDLKYLDGKIAERYSSAPDYFERADEALKEMVRQVGPCQFDEEGQMKKGVLVRHLVLPGCYKDSMDLMDYLGTSFPEESVYISLMRQYTPYDTVREKYPEINRRITGFEYEKVVEKALENGLSGFRQEKSAATMELLPKFDLTGL